MLTEEEIDFRKTRIGASDAGPILGISPFKTQYQLWEEKVLGIKQATSSSMSRGNSLEPVALSEFERMTGIPMMSQKRRVHASRDWQMATLDGLAIDGTTFVEIKCANKEVHEMAKRKEIPPYYMSQVQHQMAVCDVDKAFYFSFNGKEGVVVEVNRDTSFCDDLTEKEYAFLQLVLSKTPPQRSELDFWIRIDPDWREAATQYQLAKKELERNEGLVETLRKKLVFLAQGKNTTGEGIKLERIFRKGSIDYSQVPQLQGVDLEIYRKPGIDYWKIYD